MNQYEEVINMLVENQYHMKDTIERLANIIEKLTLEIVSIKNTVNYMERINNTK